MVKRYRMHRDFMADCQCALDEHPDGEYVPVGDYDALADERDALKARLAEAEQRILKAANDIDDIATDADLCDVVSQLRNVSREMRATNSAPRYQTPENTADSAPAAPLCPRCGMPDCGYTGGECVAETASAPFPHPGFVTADDMNKPFGPANGSGDWSRAAGRAADSADPVCSVCELRFSDHKTVISHDFRHAATVSAGQESKP